MSAVVGVLLSNDGLDFLSLGLTVSDSVCPELARGVLDGYNPIMSTSFDKRAGDEWALRLRNNLGHCDKR